MECEKYESNKTWNSKLVVSEINEYKWMKTDLIHDYLMIEIDKGMEKWIGNCV